MKESTACAACRTLRRRCPPNCILRPYFPPEKSTEFDNAHRLFGANRIEKTLKETHDPSLRDDAAKTIKYESNIRAKYPVHGCNQVIWDLERQIQLHNAELHRTRTQTAQIKSALAAASLFPTPPPLNPNYFPGDLFSGGGGHYGDSESQLPPPLTEFANHSYDNATEFLAAQQTLDSFSGGGHYGDSSYGTSAHAQQQLPASNNLPPLTENANHNYDNATEFLAAQQQQALPLGVPYSPNNDDQIQFDQTGGGQSVTNDFFSAGGYYGESTKTHGQQVLPHSNSLPSVTDNFNNNYDDATDFYSFDFPYPTNDEQIQLVPTKETGDERYLSAKYMPKDDGNPFS